MNLLTVREFTSRKNVRAALAALISVLVFVTLCGNLRIVVRPESFTTPATPDRLLLQETERVFGHSDIEAIVIDGSNRSDPAIREALKKLTRNLKQVPGVKSLVSPAHVFRDASWLPVVVWSSDRMAGRILLQIDESRGSYRETSKAIDNLLSEFPQLNPLRLSAHHLYANSAAELQNRLYDAAVTGSLGLCLAFIVLYGLSSASLWAIALTFGTTSLGLLPPVISGTPTGILGALAPLYWLPLQATLIHLICKEHPAQAISAPKWRYWLTRVLPTAVLAIPLCFLAVQAESAEWQSFLQLSVVQLLASLIPLLLGLVRTIQLQIAIETPSILSPLIRRVTPAIRRSVVFLLIFSLIYLGFGEGIVRFDGLVRSISPASGPENQLLKTVRTIFPADKTVSVILSRTDGNALDQVDDNVVERIADRLRQHPDIFAVYSPGAIANFQNLDRATRVLAGGRNPFPWLLRSFYRSEDSKTTRLLLETSLDGTALLRLQRELNDLVRAQLNLGTSGLDIEHLRPSPPKFSGLPKDQVPADFGAEVPEPLVSTPPPAINHLAAFVVSREITGETAFLANTYALPTVGLLAWVIVAVLLVLVRREGKPLFLWTAASLLIALSISTAGNGLIVEQLHPGTSLGIALASITCSLFLPFLALGLITTDVVIPGIGVVMATCAGMQMSTDSSLISNFGLAGLFYANLTALLLLSLWPELITVYERLHPLVDAQLAKTRGILKKKKPSSDQEQ